MIVTLGSEKGGAGKTTSAIHFAYFFQKLGPTLLIDNDKSKNAYKWNKKGTGLPFRVATNSQAVAIAHEFEHKVIDTGQDPSDEDLEAVVEAGPNELFIIPVMPAPMDTDGMLETVDRLVKLGATRYRVLITGVRKDNRVDANTIRQYLNEVGAPVFTSQIPRLKAFERASGQGRVVRDVRDPYAIYAWNAYEAAGQEIIG